MENNQVTLEKFEVVNFKPCRFIGKSVYIGNGGSFRIYGEAFKLSECLWKQSEPIFKTLDSLNEYASDEIHNAALITWDKYDDKNQLFGYYIGRFMKEDTPIPEDMTYFDISDTYIAKAWMGGTLDYRLGIANKGVTYNEDLVKDEIIRTGIYKELGWIWSAEIYPTPHKNDDALIGVYIPCQKI